MRLTVCELPEDRSAFDDAWTALTEHVAAADADLVVLPEMPFAGWLPATRAVDGDAWREAAAAHDRWLDRAEELAPATVVGSRPTVGDDGRLNEGFVRPAGGETRLVHRKRYLPEEPGYWEASWYESGSEPFSLVTAAGVGCGFLICTDLWAGEQAREYGASGAELLVNPRATEARTTEKWRVGARNAAIVAGAFLASSNRVTVADDPQEESPFGGHGWIVDPDGTVLAETSRTQPFVTVDVDLEAADRAKETYPRPALNDRPE